MKKIVIYPGRFQPMLGHHAEVYKKLQTEFPDADIYVGTSDKVELPKSPFNFKEKQLIAAAHGVPADRVLLANTNRPYHKDDYAQYFDESNTIIIFAVGEKDMDRFPFSNIDPKTGLDMTVRGEPRAKYYQKINTLSNSALPMSTRGYITLAPTIKLGDEVASASAFRSALKQAADRETAKKLFVKQFGSFNQKVFDLIYDKITGADMKNIKEQINQLKKLAGIPLAESAPIQFNNTADPKTAKFLPPSAASAKMSVANRFPRGVDVNDFKVKQDEFLKALMRSPEALLSEINERLDPKDNNSLEVSQKLNNILELMYSKNIGIRSLPADLRQFVLSLTVNAVRNMKLVAGDDSVDYDDEDEPVREQSTENEPDFFDELNDYEEELDENNFEDADFNKLSDQAKKILADIAEGDLDIYDVLAHPITPAEKEAAAYLQDRYDDISAERGLHPDDDVDEILDYVQDQLYSMFAEAVNPYAVGTAQAMKITGDRPPLKKSTIKKAHDIAAAIGENTYTSKQQFTSPKGVRFQQIHREDEEEVEFVYPGGKFFLYYDDKAMAFDPQEATATDPEVARMLQSLGPIENDPAVLGELVDSIISQVRSENTETVNAAINELKKLAGLPVQDLNEEFSLGRLVDIIGKLGGQVDKAKVEYYRNKDYRGKKTIENEAESINRTMMKALEHYKKFEETGNVKFETLAKQRWKTATDSYEIVVDVYRPDAAQKLLAAGCLMPMKTHVQHKWEEMLLKFDEIKDAVGARIGDFRKKTGL